MKIGVDLDEVTASFIEGFFSFYYRKTGKLFKKEDLQSYNFWEIFDGTRNDAVNLIHEFYTSPLFDEIKPVDDALEALNVLALSHELYVITARPIYMKDKTELWLQNHFVNPPKVIYSGDFDSTNGENKCSICRNMGIDILIEDNLSYALDCLGKGVTTFLLAKPWNKNVDNPQIKRFQTWADIVAEIDSLKTIKN